MPSLTAKLDKLYSTSAVLPFDNSSRIILMSDCHRGQGNGADNFLPNSMIFQGLWNTIIRTDTPISSWETEMSSGKTGASA